VFLHRFSFFQTINEAGKERQQAEQEGRKRKRTGESGKRRREKKLRQVFLFAFLLEARYRAIEQEKEERP